MASTQTTQHLTVWRNVPEKHRKCEDGGRHSGNLEVVTWDTPDHADVALLGPLGWGATIQEESEEMKQKFEVEFNGDFEKLYDYWPRAFRWTCCGLDGGYKYGCDSHVPGQCRCDNCRYGFKLPTGFIEERNKSAHAKGLTLGEGNVNGKDFD
ncbi:hypothetical protein BDZ45DRAFT_496086 [Acephala macrosclerotiorum]|nr:hypothetical protein BDZ45DRAFT_496086 [Acephala macrosclerotiorum]